VTGALVLAVASLLAPANAAPPTWTLAHARTVLVTNDFGVTDASQADNPDYDLVFTRGRAAALRPLGSPRQGRWRRFAYAGSAHDELTDTDVQVSFVLTTTGRLAAFRGPPADTSQPAFPIRATFYYAWYPEAWTRDSIYPYTLFHPSLDFYSADDAHVIRQQIDAMRYAHLNAGIYSWWGANGYPPTDRRFWRYLAAARATPFRWAIYYEPEGYGNPTAGRIRSDLEYIRDVYASQPAYLKVDGRFVVFVYGGPDDTCAMVDRWREANATVGAYLVLKAFGGHAYLGCTPQPDAWHVYAPTLPEFALTPSAFEISPGFDETRAVTPALPRDLGRWQQDVADMVASGAPWQLVLTFNEWPEGSSVESASEWASPSGYGAYLDALHDGIP
jgi:hypothetical protein